MSSFANSEALALAAQYASLLACALILLLLLQIAVLRLRGYWREQRKSQALARWRPVLIQAVMGDAFILPVMSRSDRDFFLEEWNRMYGVIRGEAISSLVKIAGQLQLGKPMRKMLRHRSIRRRLLAIITLGHMQDEDAWDELLEIMQGKQASLSVMAAGALMRIDSERALRQIIPLILERQDWPWASVAHILSLGEAERTCKILGEVTKHVSVRKQAGMLRYLDVLRCGFMTDAIHYVLRNTRDDRVLSVCLHIVDDPAALPLIRQQVDHPRGHVRVHTATALGRLGGPAELPLLLQLLNDREWWVRYRAAQAIAALPFVSNMELLRLRDEVQDRYGRDTLNQVISETLATQ